MTAFRHILVPLNCESVPRTALTTAALLATDQGAELTLLHVSDASVDFALAGFTAILDGHVKQHYERVRYALDDAWSITAEFGATASIHIANGHPIHAAIKSVAASLGADLIIVPTRGRHGVARVLRGSVTEDVLRNCPVPVLVVHESHQWSSAPR